MGTCPVRLRARPSGPCGTHGLSQPSAALFEACCGDHIQPFDDDEDDDIWEDRETRCAARVTARARCAAIRPSELPRGAERPLEACVPSPAPVVTPYCTDCAPPARFGGPPASESCSENGLVRGGQDGKETDRDAARAGAPQAASPKDGPRVEGGSEGRCFGYRVQAGQGTR